MRCILQENVWRELSHTAWLHYVICTYCTVLHFHRLNFCMRMDLYGFIRTWWRHHCSACYVSYHSSPCACRPTRHDTFSFASFLPVTPLHPTSRKIELRNVHRLLTRASNGLDWRTEYFRRKRSGNQSLSPPPIEEEVTRYDKGASCST